MRKLPWLLALAMMVFSSVSYAQVYGKPPAPLKYHLFTIPGVVNNGLATIITCTNATALTAVLGIEVFATAGGAAINNALASALSVGPGATVLFSTELTAGFQQDANLAIGLLHKGSARVLSSLRSGIICSAFLSETTQLPPKTMVNLTIVRKTVQKGQ
jgi:hypothetical protein